MFGLLGVATGRSCPPGYEKVNSRSGRSRERTSGASREVSPSRVGRGQSRVILPSAMQEYRRFDFRFGRLHRLAGAPFGIGPGRAWVDVDARPEARHLFIRFGVWSLRTP